ncbi:twin-arginine translocation signal domain-containing protein [Candidatus Daviesbacteria bacterium]|nr:twin-arginine translocation signal domain-containing protein [Candidatus Daviesbacteria bacterium]
MSCERNEQMHQPREAVRSQLISRRRFLKMALIGVGAIVGFGVNYKTSTPEQQEKVKNRVPLFKLLDYLP